MIRALRQRFVATVGAVASRDAAEHVEDAGIPRTRLGARPTDER
jgi:hypothetical protein